jgi:hypothetical protein
MQAGQPAGCQGGNQASLLAAKEAGKQACWLPRMQAGQPAGCQGGRQASLLAAK